MMKLKKLFGILGQGRRRKNPRNHFSKLKSTFFSTIGDDIVGIWPKDVKKDHINCAHATSSTIVTGDDNGAVKLFKFPCPEPGVKIDLLILWRFRNIF